MKIWDAFRNDRFVGLAPWTWVQLESAEPPGPFPYVAGVDPEIAASLYQAHQLLLSSVETIISDVFARRAAVGDPKLNVLVEDAYAELVNSRPQLRAHIRCGRQSDGSFRWEFARDPTKSSTLRNGGVRIFNAVARQAAPVQTDRPIGAAVGRLLGFLDGTHRAGELRTVAATSGRDVERHLAHVVELLHKQGCLVEADRATVREHWLARTCDRDMVHLGHAALLYRAREEFFLFDPWLMPWFAESPVPSPWGMLLPRPSAIFLTHDHDDHVDPRTLLHMPKNVPVIVPSRRNRRMLHYDYLNLLRELGFGTIVELAHGESWKFEGGEVVSVPFFGEDPCDLEMPRNCYLVVDRGQRILVHADSGPTNDGRSPLNTGVIRTLVDKYGPIGTVFASQQQLMEVRTYAAHAALSPPGRWLDPGENGFLTNQYLADLIQACRAVMFVSYATGGADWYPDHLSFMFSRRNPARTALLTANWESPGALAELVKPMGCHYHYSHALDTIRSTESGRVQVIALQKEFDPATLYCLDHETPPFFRSTGRS